MNVELLAYLQPSSKLHLNIGDVVTPEALIDSAARSTRTTSPMTKLIKESVDHPEETAARIKKYIKMGHFTVAGFTEFVFLIEGISRACSHELVRHRTAWYLQQSQRRVNISELPVVTPWSIQKDPYASANFELATDYCKARYKELIELGIPEEDARFVMPNASTTRVIMKIDGSNLMHFFKLRLAPAAMWEIRELANKMYEKVKEVCPNLFSEELKDNWW